MFRRPCPLLVLSALVFSACQDVSDPVGPAASPTPSLSVQQQPDQVMRGRVLVRLSEGTDPADFARSRGVALQDVPPSAGFAMLGVTAGSERAMAARLAGDERVIWAEPDYLRRTTTIDPRLWAFSNPGGLEVYFTRGRNKGSAVASYRSVADADEDNVEGYAAGGSSVAIASIDTGVDFTHPEFAGLTLVKERDYYDGDDDPTDTNDHGTHTTGTMVGNTVGVAGVAGAAGNVTVHVYRVCGALGCPTSAIVQAIRAAADRGVVAMNLSLGGGSLSQAEADAIGYATGKGSLVVASAGNDGTSTVSCPACDPNAISVAASDWLDEHAYYTNWGSGLDLIAPGGELYGNTTDEAGIYSAVRGGYAYFQGTSMSAPQVTGTAAIVASVTGLTGAALRSRLESSTDDLGPTGYDAQFGHGRLNSYRAVTGTDLGDGDPPPPPPPPEGLAAAFEYSCSDLSCVFDGTSSTGNPTSHDWDFGDGATASGSSVSHTFGGVGTYPVTLTVSDGTDSDSATKSVQCTQRGPRVRCR